MALIFLSGKLVHVVLAGLVSLAALVIVVLSVIGDAYARCMAEGQYYDISDGYEHYASCLVRYSC